MIITREKAMVVDFRASVATAFSLPIDQFILTYAGKIIKDQENLDSLGISAGEMLHLVRTSVIIKLLTIMTYFNHTMGSMNQERQKRVSYVA